jgi:predicted nuclease of predicted toxin-antitoxin system
MALSFFLDHCVPFSVEKKLSQGHEVFLLRNHLPRDSPDAEVIQKAQELNAILVSLNGDFSNIIQFPPSSYSGIIALQVKNRPEIIPDLLDRLGEYLNEHPDQRDYAGKLVLVEVHRIRIVEGTSPG